jgi:glycosyltransferase involved in cell wall biosynthesis
MVYPGVSAAVLTLNEARNIGRCLGSLAWADEIVVIDAGSTDGTVEIARGFTERVIHHPWTGFLEQRRLAFDHCSHDWVLALDADEWIVPELGDEIRRTLESDPASSAFWINRRNWFIDRWIDHAWAPDYVLRLFRKNTVFLEGWEPHIHVALKPGHSAETLSNPLLHQAYFSVSELCVKADRYSTQFAAADATDGHYSPIKMILSPLVSVIKTLVCKRGFLDGAHGLVIALSTAYYHFLKYAKKWEKLRRKESHLPERMLATHQSSGLESSPEPEGHGN